jgi:hypothetical protein
MVLSMGATIEDHSSKYSKSSFHNKLRSSHSSLLLLNFTSLCPAVLLQQLKDAFAAPFPDLAPEEQRELEALTFLSRVVLQW